MHRAQIFAFEMQPRILTVLMPSGYYRRTVNETVFPSRIGLSSGVSRTTGRQRGPGCKLRFAEYRKHGNCTSLQPRYLQECTHSADEREEQMKREEIRFAYFTPLDNITLEISSNHYIIPAINIKEKTCNNLSAKRELFISIT